MTSISRRIPAGLVVVLLLGIWGPAPGLAGDEPAAGPPDATIDWHSDLPAAFEKAAEEKKVVMICINARHAIGEHEEPAAKGLREVVYLDPAVVEKSRSFVCVLLTAEGSSEDYGELRYRFGISGFVVSPQHVFAHPEHRSGAKPLVRKEYWAHGSGESGVKALLALMDEALEAYRVREGLPATPPGGEDGGDEGEDAPEAGEARAAWIAKLVGLSGGSDAAMRQEALATLLEHDRDGDCTTPLVALLDKLESAKEVDVDALVDVVRVLGVPGLEAALPALHRLLKHGDAEVRGNVAVTLEYIGSRASAEPLLARAKREKDEGVANHLHRAIGRCGAGDATARKRLLRSALPGKKSDFGSFGAVIGLAYFEGDEKAARALEKQLAKLGSPLKQGSGAHTFLRAALAWCLGEIGDPKTARFLRKKILEPLEEESSPWKGHHVGFYDAVARKCEGQADAGRAVEAGISWARWADGARDLVDACRSGRDMRRFVPKGEWGNRPAAEDDEEEE